MPDKIRGHSFAALPVLILLLAAVFPGRAVGLSVESVSVEQALDRSALIVEGRVTAAEAKPVDGSSLIRTCLQLEVSDVLKGWHRKPTLEFCFVGGSLGSRTLRIAGLRYPKIGERGIYFLENPGRLQVHPVYGAEQGVFLLRQDPASGRDAVFTSGGLAVTGLGSSGGLANPGLSNGVARGIATARSPGGKGAMAKADFKASLRALLKR